MAALDTNVLVRFLVRDDAEQLAAARKLIGRYVSEGDALRIPISVSLELEWVLRSNFGFDKRTVLQALSGLLSAAELSFQSERALELALERYSQSSAEYSDCLHTALALVDGEQPLWTFDKAASKLEGARLVPR